MCRFLLAKSNQSLDTISLLKDFARMCEKSHAPDGDWQGDGFGISWLENGKWKLLRSLDPIWNSQDLFEQVPETRMLVVHARSAGFPQHKGVIEYNQPYIEDDICFVFNGMIRGVSLNVPLEGKIGAQKIFSLIRKKLQTIPPTKVLKAIDEMILSNSKKVVGMNIGLVVNDQFHLLCEYDNNPGYFGINYFKDESISVVCSEQIETFNWKVMSRGETLSL